MESGSVIMAAHSAHGYSGQSRIIACPGSAAMQEGFANTSNPQSELGTAVHEATEFALNMGIKCEDVIGMTFNGIVIKENDAHAGDVYVNYVNEIMRIYPDAELIIEGKVYMHSIDAKLLWGTSDCIVIVRSQRLLIVGDYKNGYGIVEVEDEQMVFGSNSIRGNAQTVGYGLATMDTYNLHGQIDWLTTFIAQPNVDHIDGPVRVRTYTVDELKSWHDVYRYTHSLALEGVKHRQAGKHCKYCRARGHCTTRLTYILQLLQIDQAIATCDAEQLIAIYNEIDVITYTLEAVKEQVIKLARKGHKIPGRKLVKGIVRASCSDEDGLVKEAVESGINREKLFNMKLKGKTDIKTIIGKNLADKYYVTPEAGYTLVGLSDKRPAVMADSKPSAAGVFSSVINK